MRFLPALLALAPAVLLAQGQDPLKSAACAEGLASLQEARAGGAAEASVQALRQGAARTCLGGGGDAPARPARVIQPPVAIPPPAIVPAPVIALPQVLPPPPPVAIQRLPAVTTCDIGGCWADDGQHLRQVGPNLAGPNGRCSQQGGLVYCP